MDTQMIYILDEKIPFSELKEKLEKTQPLTKEEVVDLIISKVDDKDESNFKSFEKKYLKTSFTNLSNLAKYDIFLEDLKNMEDLHENLGTWNDPTELKSDIMANLFSFHLVDGKTVLYNYQIEDWIKTASEYHLLYQKKEYLSYALKKLKSLIADKIEFSNQSEIITNGPLKGADNSSDKKRKLLDSDKKIPEKWYALLHMIYYRMGRVELFKNISDKKTIIEYGKSSYPIKGQGQRFYYEIHRIIDSGSLYNHIHVHLKKDFKKWKKIILNISGDDGEVKNWIDKNLK